MKKISSISILLMLLGCVTTQNVTPAKYNPNFGFTPESRAQISEKSLTVAILDPVFSNGEENNLVEPYTSFVRNMADDIEETLNANGFKIKGPYKNRDEMVYGDKLDSDFAIEVTIEVLGEKGDFGARPLNFGESMVYKDCYKLGGTFYHKGRITLTATDPMDGEKFWKKTVDLDRKPVVTQGTQVICGPIGNVKDAKMLSDVGIYNPVAKVLESYYSDALTSISRHIDHREMENISKQIKGKRKRVGQ